MTSVHSVFTFFFQRVKFIIPWVFSFYLPVCLNAQGTINHKLKLEACIGYSVENLDWSIAGLNSNSQHVNVLSELEWKNTVGPCLFFGGEIYVWKELFVGADFSNTFITSGSVTDTDFQTNNREDVVFHDTFDSGKGRTWNFRTSIGYQILFLKKYSIRPGLGYGSDLQSLFMLRDYGNVQGDMRSTYQTKWHGPFGGLDLIAHITNRVSARARTTYHQVKYYAKADWNLIQNFKHPISFEHNASGYGLSSSVDFVYLFTKRTSAILSARYSYWTTGKGTDTLYRSDGSVIITQLNAVHRTNVTLSAGIEITLIK